MYSANAGDITPSLSCDGAGVGAGAGAGAGVGAAGVVAAGEDDDVPFFAACAAFNRSMLALALAARSSCVVLDGRLTGDVGTELVVAAGSGWAFSSVMQLMAASKEGNTQVLGRH
jgi:hypothetical protein